MRDEDIVSAARALRKGSPDLWSDAGGRADMVDALLRLAEAGERVGDELLVLLTSDASLREELSALLLADEDTYRQVSGNGGYAPLAGHGAPSAEMLYHCPACDYTYPVFEAGEPVPEGCPDGHGPLVLSG
ncbi:hypothetical protein AB0G20_38085 [Streptomyces sp. NPDC024017]|uniref:hypothetical protein n=1 Tax=Streptomyces sp. NPDC024017 TaxID=3154326 RepID=UPI0033DCE528